MPIRIQDNTKYHPLTIKDMLFRNGNFATTSFMPDEIVTEINSEWIYYLCQYSQYMGNDSDLLSTYIFQNYSERHLLDKFSDWFEGWDESNDYSIYEQMVIDAIHRTLIANIEKYNKLYYTMTAEFNPLWNVDGTEVIERTLDQTGTDANAKTGNDTNVRTGNETDEKSGSEANTRTGSESDVKSGSETRTTSRTTFDSATFYDAEKETTSPSLLTNTHNYTNVADTTSFTNRKDTHTYNTVQDKMTYLSTNTETRNLHDNERIIHTRQGNIGVVSSVKLLQEFAELANLNFIEIVAADIVNSITFMCY